MYVLGHLLGSISQSNAASGQAQSAANQQSLQALANAQNSYGYNEFDLDRIRRLQNAGYSVGPRGAILGPMPPIDIVATTSEPAIKWAEAVQPSEHELELMRWDENLAALKQKTAEMHAEIKARVFPQSPD